LYYLFCLSKNKSNPFIAIYSFYPAECEKDSPVITQSSERTRKARQGLLYFVKEIYGFFLQFIHFIPQSAQRIRQLSRRVGKEFAKLAKPFQHFA